MNFTARQYQQLAKRADVSERALRRLLGSVSVEFNKLVESEEDGRFLDQTERFNLGLRLTADVMLRIQPDASFMEEVVETFYQYQKLCPLVYAWLLSGSFDSHKPPERISRQHLLHASRTAGRLRARLLRSR